MAEDGKRSELVCFKATERMALDLLRVATAEDRSVSDFMFGLLHKHLYGHVARLDKIRQFTTSDKVDQ